MKPTSAEQSAAHREQEHDEWRHPQAMRDAGPVRQEGSAGRGTRPVRPGRECESDGVGRNCLEGRNAAIPAGVQHGARPHQPPPDPVEVKDRRS